MLKRPRSAISSRASRTASVDVPTALLGHLSPADFMRRYWQKKPLLIRQAIPGISAPLTREALFDLACSGDAEARLVTYFRKRWQLEHGPFEDDELPDVAQKAWTLLVQGVDLHDDAARALLEQFRFIPDARLDDLMISYATDGGGVGPHFDSYDVFLLQVHGKRRWRISAQTDLTLHDDLPLKILKHFEADQEWVLEPGDMLYLPPHIAHDGVAVGECMTCSIGFRAPRAGELRNQFLYHLAERGTRRADDDKLYRDPRQPAVEQPARLPAPLVERVTELINGIRWNERDVSSFLGCYLSEPKPDVVFDPPARPLTPAAFAKQAARRGLSLDRRCALLYDAREYFINGEAFPLADVRGWLPLLADRRSLPAEHLVTIGTASTVTNVLYEWYCAGWVRISIQK